MNEVTPLPAGAGSAGAMLRAARQSRGLEIDALAQVLKVPERKLAALEADRYDELPGLAFVRSLAQSYARQVGLDVARVLALLPLAITPPQQLENVSRGLQTPYREGAGGHTFGRGGGGSALPEWLKLTYVLPALLLLALAFWFAPPMRSMFGTMGWSSTTAEVSGTGAVSEALVAPSGVVVSEPAAIVPVPVPVPVPLGASTSALVAPPSPPQSVVASETVHSAPVPAVTEASVPPTAAGTVVVRTTSESWIEVRDAKGAVLLSRTVLPGEVVGLEGALPMRLKAGIANVTQVTLRGEPFDLGPFTRGNVATAILK